VGLNIVSSSRKLKPRPPRRWLRPCRLVTEWARTAGRGLGSSSGVGSLRWRRQQWRLQATSAAPSPAPFACALNLGWRRGARFEARRPRDLCRRAPACTIAAPSPTPASPFALHLTGEGARSLRSPTSRAGGSASSTLPKEREEASQ
jgi:hypothetical protein